MPSVALRTFEQKMVISAERLLEVHGTVNYAGRGRRDLQHVTHSGVVMLCAAWELYIEQVLVEAVGYLCESLDDVQSLPTEVKKKIVYYSNLGKNELSSLQLCGGGWKDVYKNGTEQTVSGLNTPKSTNIDPVFVRTSDSPIYPISGVLVHRALISLLA